MQTLVQDVRYAVRQLRRSPGFTTVAVLTLALGIGANATIFSQVNAVLWKTLPVERPEELRQIAWTSPRPGFVGGTNSVSAGPRVPVGDSYGTFSYPAFLAMRDGNTSFSDLACWVDVGERRPVVIENGFVTVQFVSGNYFQTLGVRPILGRTIAPDDDQFGSESAGVTVLSYRFWQRRYGGDPEVVNQTIDLNTKPFAIVGVMPEDFFGLDPATSPDMMVPLTKIQIISTTVNPLAIDSNWVICRPIGRLLPGVSNEQARIDLERWVHDEIQSYQAPAEYDLPRLWLLEARHGVGNLQAETLMPLVILMSVVGGILLIACANIAGLMLARGSARQKEIATRLSLGASRGRLIQQLLTESVLLSVIGGVAGFAFAIALVRLLPSLISQLMPTMVGFTRIMGVGVTPDLRVLAFSAGLTVLTGVLFGLVPALRATRVDLNSMLKQGGSATAQVRVRFASGKAMVGVQSALAMLFLIGAGLFIRTVANLRSAELGYEPEGVLYVKIEPNTGGIPPQQRAAFFESAVRQLQNVPGAVSVSAVARPPLGDDVQVALERLACASNRPRLSSGISDPNTGSNCCPESAMVIAPLNSLMRAGSEWADSLTGPALPAGGGWREDAPGPLV